MSTNTCKIKIVDNTNYWKRVMSSRMACKQLLVQFGKTQMQNSGFFVHVLHWLSLVLDGVIWNTSPDSVHVHLWNGIWTKDLKQECRELASKAYHQHDWICLLIVRPPRQLFRGSAGVRADLIKFYTYIHVFNRLALYSMGHLKLNKSD